MGCHQFFLRIRIIICYLNDTVMHRLVIGGKIPSALLNMKTFGTVMCHQYSVFNFNFIDKSYMLVFIKLLDFYFFKTLGHTIFLHQLHNSFR